MAAPARRACFDVLCKVEFRGRPSDSALHSEKVSRLRPIDRSLATEIAYGTLRWQGWLDYLLSRAITIPADRVEPEARIILRMSLYQLAWMERVPDHAVVNDAVELAKQALRRRAPASFVNGVLRRLTRERPWAKPGFDSDWPGWARVSLPQWLWERWTVRFGAADAAAYARSLNEPPAQTFWVVDGIPQDGSVAGADPSPLVPGAFVRRDRAPVEQAAKSSRLHYQDEASQLIPHLLGRLEGMRVWDACAAPGGKSLILQRKLGGSGLVVASDVNYTRAAELAAKSDPATAGSLAVLAADASRPAPFKSEFDAVLADVPCSGLGTLRRNPEIKWRFRTARLPLLHDAQLLILSEAARAVRRGGRLLYSTCSTEPEENEQVVRRFLLSRQDFQVRRPDTPPGVDQWLDGEGFLRTFPGRKRWDGFFAVLMARFS